MSADRGFERALPDILADLGAGPTDDYSQLLARTARTRQRPAWSFLERWLPMDLAVRPTTAIITPRRLVAVVALLLLATLIGVALLAGSRQTTLPAPFGVARNGLIVFADPDGHIQVGDLDTHRLRTLSDGPGDTRPRVSPDGTQVAYLHERGFDSDDIVVVGMDGSARRTITKNPMTDIGFFEWTPDGHSVVISSHAWRFRYDAAKASDPVTLARDGSEDGGMDYSNQLATFSRPPDGAQVAYLGTSQGHDTLKVANADGSGATVIVDDPCCRDMLFPVWSNDGTRIGFTASKNGDQPFWAYIVDADGKNLHRLFDDGIPAHNENGFAWSPDDTMVAMQRWFGELDGAASVRPITVVTVATGDRREVGEISYNGFKAWHWSPDGKSIIAAPDDGTDRILIIDVAHGGSTDTGWRTTSGLSWQRLAP